MLRACALGCHTAQNRCRAFTPLNLPLAALTDPVAGDVTLSNALTYSTTSCNSLGSATASVVNGSCVLRASTFSIGANLTVQGDKPLILVGVNGIRVSARLDVRAAGATPGPGGFAGGTTDEGSGQGPGGGTGGSHAGTYDDAGGGGGGHGAQGGAGGDGGGAQGGAGGDVVTGLTGFEPLQGGSGGGAGGFRGRGGGGGGAVQLVSLSTINIPAGGGIIAPGGGGRPANGLSNGNWGSGGGGGAGGTILLEAPAIQVVGRVAAHGGGGAGSDACGSGIWESGGPGSPGSVDGTAAPGGASGGNCNAPGGDGSSTVDHNGQPGTGNTSTYGNGGGGGGGAGRIMMRLAPSTPIVVVSTVTPGAEFGAVTVEP